MIRNEIRGEERATDLIASIVDQVQSRKLDLRDVGQVLTGKWDQDDIALILNLAWWAARVRTRCPECLGAGEIGKTPGDKMICGVCYGRGVASCDTHPKGENSAQTEVSFMSGEVPEGQTPNPSHPSSHSGGR